MVYILVFVWYRKEEKAQEREMEEEADDMGFGLFGDDDVPFSPIPFSFGFSDGGF